MPYRSVTLAFLFLTTAAMSAESCGLLAARQLSGGDLDRLVKLFDKGDPSTRAQLAELARLSGGLSELKEVTQPRFNKSTRHNAMAPNLPSTYKFNRHLVNALSTELGSVQLQIEVEPRTRCRVLAMRVYVAAHQQQPAPAQPIPLASRQ